MLKASKHYIRYDAMTYLEKGFTTIEGNVRHLSKKPRHWKIVALASIDNGETIDTTPIVFNTDGRFKLSELVEFVNKEIHEKLAKLENCISCIISAYIMTEDGK